MSDYLNNLINSSEQGEANDVFGKDAGGTSESFMPSSTPFPDGFEAVEAEEARPILGNVVGIGAELGYGLYLTKKLHKSQQFLKWANKAKTAAVVGMAAPEPASSVGGVLTFAAAEAAIWGTGNLIGQNIRKAYGVQDNVSAGEVLASSVFGVGLMTKAGQKLISMGDGLASMKAWGKGNELFIAGTKSFVSGATLGVAETALRQEVQIMLNERENRDVMEYLIGGAAGGGFNTMFDVFSRTGKWGQAKAKMVTRKAKESLAKKADELEARAKTLPRRSRGKLLKEARQIRKAIEVTDDLGQQLDASSEALNNPKPKQEEAPEAPAEPTPAPKKPEVSPEAPKQPVTPRGEQIETLRTSLEGLDSSNMSKQMPRIERDAKAIYRDIYDNIGVQARKLQDVDDPEARAQLLELVKDLRKVNREVKDVVETTAGRTLQAARKDADKYKWTDTYSLRSQQEDAQLAILEDTLERGGKVVDEVKPVAPNKINDPDTTTEGTKPKKPTKEKTPEQKASDEFRLQLLTDIENAFYKALDADSAGFVTKSMRWVAQSRQMALINQLPSALAGVPTGAIALVREVNRGVTNYTAQKFAGNPLAGELAKVDIMESLANFKNLFSKDTGKAVARTLKENQSATDPRKAGRMDDDIQNISLPRGEAALVARARRRAEKATKAKESLVQKAGQEGAETVLERMNRIYFLGQSGGVRLIQGIDEGFKRTIALGRVRASARKEAILELSENQSANGVKYTEADVDALAKQKYESALIDSDGLMVLRANHEYIEEVDLSRRELLFAANSDNIDEVVAPYSEQIVQTLKRLAGTDHPFSFAINAIMPYIGVPIRGVAKGMSWMGAPIRILGMPRGSVVGNPYIRKIKEAQLELDALDSVAAKRGDSPFDEQGLEAVNTLEGSKAEILERIDRLEARRIQYNSDTMADALMTLELVGLMGAAAWAGNASGSLSFLNDDQKKKMGLVGVKPFKLFGMDYKAIGPAAFPLTVAGDITSFVKIRTLEAQLGQTILDEDLSIMDVIVKSVVSMAGDQPLSTGAKQITEILGSDEQRKVAASSMVSGYTPVPAQVKKAIQQYNNAGRMVDLKGSSFADRLAYGALGMGISNFKTDYFGFDISDPRGFIQNNVMRQWPDAKKTRDTFENIVGSDITGVIQSKPEYLRTGVRMKDFVDERGVSMTYRFDQQLKETKIGGKTMHAAVYALITNNLWRAKFDEGPKPDANGELTNEGLFELNKLMRQYYDKTKEDILNNVAITSRFINKDDITLKDELERYEKGDFLKTFGQPNLADILN